MVETTDLTVLSNGLCAFTASLQEKLKKPDTNNVFAPISIHEFLVLVSQDPWFYNKEFFNGALHVDVNKAAEHYRHIFSTEQNCLLSANTSFLRHDRVVLDKFRKILAENFRSELSPLNFTEREDFKETINTWMRDNTHQEMTCYGGLSDDTILCFLSALDFNRSWSQLFPTQNTVQATFYLNSQSSIGVQMMKTKDEFYYRNDLILGAQVLKLPLADSNASLVIVLPKNEITLDQLEQRVKFTGLSQLSKNMTKQKVEVSFPKFKMEKSFELAKYLKEMGFDEVFAANLTGVVEGEELNLSEIQQSIFLEVNEAGLELAASTSSTLIKARDEKIQPKDGLKIYEASMSTEISNRFARTKVVWRVNNSNTTATSAQFKVILTETAFITDFVMNIEGKKYKSFIKEKEEAKNLYNKAVAQGQSAGLVEAKTRDSREFTVSVNLEPDSVAVFSLIYEEMLQRIHDQYELVLNICPGQVIEDLSIEVRINESLPLSFVKTPPLRSGDDISKTECDMYLDPSSKINMINSKTATVKFSPSPARQKKLAHYLGRPFREGLLGQFVVQYDVEREPCEGEVFLQDGFFVHFFASNELDPLPKHIIFVLDTSGSMKGRKIEQLKDAMTNILSDLGKGDMLSLIEFNSDVIVWDTNTKKIAQLSDRTIKDYRSPFVSLQRYILANPQHVSDSIIEKAKEIINAIEVGGQTFMIGGLETALYIVKIGEELIAKEEEKPQPVIVFLTDGFPNVGETSTAEIVEIVTNLNTTTQVPIFSLSFGRHADKDFLRRLSHKNFAFSRHIYEAADASLQLQDFYKQISSPVLRDVKFKYDEEVKKVTKTWFPIYFKGSELIVAGQFEGSTLPNTIDCYSLHGFANIKSTLADPVTSLERLWAYLTVKQLLHDRETSNFPNQLTEEAVKLAMKYSFVTDVTSLVVVKPDENTLLHAFGELTMNAGLDAVPTFGSSASLSQAIFGTTSDTVLAFGSNASNSSGLMFGGTPSGGSLFGAPTAGSIFRGNTSASSPGSSFAVAPQVSPFGNKASAPASSGFGGKATATITPAPVFAIKQVSTSTTASIFGTTQVALGDPMFGSKTSPASSAVGASTSTTASIFGTVQAPSFNFGFPQTSTSPASSVFGTTRAAAPRSSTFGASTSTTASIFGTNQASTSSAPSVFGNTLEAPASSIFGGTAMKSPEKFIANHPFLVILQVEKDDNIVIICKGRIYKPIC